MYIILIWLFLLTLFFVVFVCFKKNQHLHKHHNSYMVNLIIEFNVNKINDFIKNNESLKDIYLLNDEKDSNWEDTVVKKVYKIDILPNDKHEIFFHRATNTFSHLVDAYDCFDNSDEDINKYIRNIKIKKFSWELWKDYIAVDVTFVNKKKKEKKIPIILVPIYEMVQLMLNGEVKGRESGLRFNFKCEKIKIPLSFESSDLKFQPEDFIEVWKRTGHPYNWVTYSNTLVSISAEVPSKGVIEY